MGTPMNFSVAITNPPYNTKNDIHAEIAAKWLESVDDVISLMPGTFMKRNGNNRHERYRNAFERSIYSYEEVENMAELFHINYDEGAIFHFKKNKGKVNYDFLMDEANELMDEANELMDELENNQYFNGLTKVSEKLEDYKIQRFFVPVGTHGENILTFAGLLIDGVSKKGDKMNDLLKTKFNDKNNNGKGLSFKTKNEAETFIEYTKTNIFKDLMVATKAGTGNNFRHNLRFAPIQKIDEKKVPGEKIANLAMKARNFKSRSN